MLRHLVLLVLALCTQSAGAATILIVGDSLSAAYGLRIEDGWVHLLQAQHPEHVWINASISGDTTQEGLSRLPGLLARHEPDVLVIELGANDALRGTPVHVPRDNLQTMIDHGKAMDARVLLLGVRIPTNYGSRYTKEFAAIYPTLAKKNGIYVVPFFLEAIATDPAHFQADRLHPNAHAQPLIARTVWPTLQQALASPAPRAGLQK